MSASTKRALLFVGDDALAEACVDRLRFGEQWGRVDVAKDVSLTARKVLRLLGRRSLALRHLLRMAWAMLLRRRSGGLDAVRGIRGNAQLATLLDAGRYDLVVMYRVSLIVDAANIAKPPLFLNVHCGRLPEYGGLAALCRALDNGDLEQAAVAHRVTKKIDDPETIVDSESFLLDPRARYAANEERASRAGCRLVRRVLSERC